MKSIAVLDVTAKDKDGKSFGSPKVTKYVESAAGNAAPFVIENRGFACFWGHAGRRSFD